MPGRSGLGTPGDGGWAVTGLSLMLRSFGRFAAAATAAVTVAGGLALVSAPAAYAAGTVSSPSPSSVSNSAASTSFTFTTSDAFLATPRVQLLRTGQSAVAFDVQGSSNPVTKQITASFDFSSMSPLLAPGGYDVRVCSAGSTNGCDLTMTFDVGTNILTLTSTTATVTGLSKAAGATNAAPITNFTITGTNFATADRADFVPVDPASQPTPPTLTITGLTKTAITGTLDLTGASSGTYDVVVTDAKDAATSKSAADRFQVVALPTIQSLSSPSVGVGAGDVGPAELVTIIAANFPPTHGASVTISGGPTAQVQSIAADQANASLTDVIAAVSAPTGTAPNADTLTLTDTTSGGSAPHAFAVTAAPTLTDSAGAIKLGQGATNHTLTFAGADLQPGAGMVVTSPSSGVSTSDPLVNAQAQTLSLNATALTSAPAGGVALSVINPDAGISTYAASASPFAVTAAPVLSSADPATILRPGSGSADRTVTLNGANFDTTSTPPLPTATVPTGRGLTVKSFTVTDASTATLVLTVASTATTGTIPVTVTNPDGGSTGPVNVVSIDTFVVSDITRTGSSPASASGSNGSSSVPITVTGSGIPSGAQLKLTPAFPVVGQAPIVISGTATPAGDSWTGTADLIGAAAGPYQVQLFNGSGTGTCTCQFTITSAGAPTVATVAPTALAQGVDSTLTITGTKFARGATVTFSKSGFTTTGPVTFVSPTQLTVPVRVASNASTGLANATNVTVTNTGPVPNSASCSACLSADAAPTITSLSPAKLAQGANGTLTINGTNFLSGATVVFGTGVTSTSAPTVTATRITVPVTVAPTAPNNVSVKVTNPDQGSATSSLAITPGPKVNSVSPQYVADNFTGTLTLTGTGFLNGAQVSFPAGSGVAIPANGTTTVTGNGSIITVPIAVSRTTPLAVDVTVTNTTGDLGAGTCSQCLNVAIAPAAPTGAKATRSGSSATVTWNAVPTSADGGAPITGYTVSVASPANSGVASQTVTPPATSATFTGLNTGTDYTFAVVATNEAGLSSPAATTRPSTLSISASAARIVDGQVLMLSGRLADAAGDPIANASITVHRRSDSGATNNLTVATDTAGRWLLSTRPKHNATYAAAFAGDSTHQAVTSAAVRTVVSPLVTIHADSRSSVGAPLVVKGHVAPNKRGNVVTLTIRDAAGKIVKSPKATLRSDSTYRFAVKLGKGSYTLQVRIGRSSGNEAGRSVKRHVKRT